MSVGTKFSMRHRKQSIADLCTQNYLFPISAPARITVRFAGIGPQARRSRRIVRSRNLPRQPSAGALTMGSILNSERCNISMSDPVPVSSGTRRISSIADLQLQSRLTEVMGRRGVKREISFQFNCVGGRLIWAFQFFRRKPLGQSRNFPPPAMDVQESR